MRNQKIQQAENKLKQREWYLASVRKKSNVKDGSRSGKENLEAQLVIVDKKKKNSINCNSRKSINWKQSPDCLPKRPKNAW